VPDEVSKFFQSYSSYLIILLYYIFFILSYLLLLSYYSFSITFFRPHPSAPPTADDELRDLDHAVADDLKSENDTVGDRLGDLHVTELWPKQSTNSTMLNQYLHIHQRSAIKLKIMQPWLTTLKTVMKFIRYKRNLIRMYDTLSRDWINVSFCGVIWGVHWKRRPKWCSG
jgi:hypothetical protein